MPKANRPAKVGVLPENLEDILGTLDDSQPVKSEEDDGEEEIIVDDEEVTEIDGIEFTDPRKAMEYVKNKDAEWNAKNTQNAQILSGLSDALGKKSAAKEAEPAPAQVRELHDLNTVDPDIEPQKFRQILSENQQILAERSAAAERRAEQAERRAEQAEAKVDGIGQRDATIDTIYAAVKAQKINLTRDEVKNLAGDIAGVDSAQAVGDVLVKIAALVAKKQAATTSRNGAGDNKEEGPLKLPGSGQGAGAGSERKKTASAALHKLARSGQLDTLSTHERMALAAESTGSRDALREFFRTTE